MGYLQYFKAHWVWVLILILIARSLYIRYASPLRKYPGPFLASCSRLWKLWVTYGGHSEHDFMQLHRKYGPIVRTGPNEISLASPKAARDVFASGKGFSKTDFYWVFPPAENPDVFTEIREWKHAQMKRYTVAPYSLSAMLKMSSLIQDVENDLFEKLDEFVAPEGRGCDLGSWLHWFAFDVIGEVAFSRRYGFVRSGSDVQGCIEYIDRTQAYNGLVGQIPWLHYLLRLNPLGRFVPGFATRTVLLTQMALDELSNRKEGRTEPRDDLLAQLLRAHANNPNKFSEDDVFSVAHGAIGAGSDSTASTMQSFWWLLLNSPDRYEMVLAEIDEADRTGNLSTPIAYAEAQKLSFFQACLLEAMRLRPAVGLNIYRRVPQGGLEIDGQFYPGDVEIALNGWVLHRDRAVFGKDADEYRPERWLQDDSKGMHRHMYQFGGGSHLCLGRNLALLEMNMLLPELLRHYRFRLVYPGRPLTHQTSFFVVQSGLEVFVAHREKRPLKHPYKRQ